MGYFIYVLKSNYDGIRYIGSGTDPNERLRRHNKGDCRFTKGHRPWELVYKESYETKSEAVRRERFLKSGQGRKLLDKILSEAGGSSNGRTPTFGVGYEGSIPSPPASDGISRNESLPGSTSTRFARSVQALIVPSESNVLSEVEGKMFYVYFLKDSEGHLYIGQTNDLFAREKQQSSKSTKSAKFIKDTSGKFDLVYKEEYPTRLEAMRREKQVKGWTRAKKEALISKNYGLLKKLCLSQRINYPEFVEGNPCPAATS